MMDQTGDAIANEVLLVRDTYNGSVLILEGDNDEKLFRRFVEDSEMPIIPAWGKEKVLDAVEILESCDVQGFLGIVDADFGHVDGSLPTSRNIVVTDDHDVEMMIVKTKAFSAVLRELGSRAKVRNFPDRERGIRDALMQKALIIGHLRHLSVTDDLRLRFEGLRFERFVDRNSLKMNVNKMINNVFALTRNPQLEMEDIRDRLSELAKDATDDPYQICCGHDFIAIFGIALRKVLGSRQSKETTSQALGVALRLAYDSEDFRQTKLYSDAKQWSARNRGYDIFMDRV